MRTSLLLILPLLFLSCHEKKRPPVDSTLFAPGKPLGQLTDKRLREVSGLAASAVNPGLLWTHNDSGNPAAVYLVDEQLTIRMTCRLKGVKNRDWEDIAIGPGPDGDKHYLYVADIGDNNATHDVKYIYRFEEPGLRDEGPEITITSFDTIALSLEDGRKDTETIMIHPQTKNIYIVSKRENPVYVYELKYPYEGSQPLMAKKVVSLPLTQIVAGAMSADGNEIVLKNYEEIYYWQDDDASVADMLRQKPLSLNYEEEPQGEAIAFDSEGAGFYTLSEKVGHNKVFLYYYARKSMPGK